MSIVRAGIGEAAPRPPGSFGANPYGHGPSWAGPIIEREIERAEQHGKDA